MQTNLTLRLTEDDMSDLARVIPNVRSRAEAITVVKVLLLALAQKMSFISVTFTDKENVGSGESTRPTLWKD